MTVIREANMFPTLLLAKVSLSPDIRYIPSQFAIPFEHRGKHYVFQNITKQFIEGTLPEEARAGEGYDELIRARFLVPEDMDECAFHNRASALMRAGSRKEKTYPILTTLGCNARCVYCYEEGLAQTAMTEETADQVVRYILETHTQPEVELGWFGGEPLLGEKIIDRICKGLLETGLPYRSIMVSNGSLITPEIIRKMTGDWKLYQIQISMDGAEKDYISRKRYTVYHDNYRRVMESIGRLAKEGIQVKVACNVDEENWNGIGQFLQDLSAAVTDKENVYVYFHPLFSVRHGDGDVAMRKKILEARPLIEKAGFLNLPILSRGLTFPPYRCSVAVGKADIFPDGSLYPCATIAPKDRYGDIWHGITDESAMEKYIRPGETREKCRSCPYLPNCTSYSYCPVTDKHCREVMELRMQAIFRELVEDRERETADGES